MLSPPTNQGVTRQQSILTAAVGVAERDGYNIMKRDDIAIAANCATGSVHRYFDTMENLRTLVMEHAIKAGNTIMPGSSMPTHIINTKFAGCIRSSLPVCSNWSR